MDHLRAREGEGHQGGVSPAVADSLQYLRSEAARASIASDPYWPKWHSPWWHVLALHEAGVTPPREAVVMLAEGASRHYLTLFPRAPEALPAGKSLDTDVMCFCALGSLLQVTHGIATIPWADDFLRRYQLPDGGWNCEPHDHVSSVVSTVPVLEYLLLRPELKPMLDRGMAYLLERKLFRSKRTGRVIDEAWLTPTFPRFYEYDVLRGLELVARWDATKAPAEALALEHQGTRCWPLDARASGAHGAETTFPLLDALAAEGPRMLSRRRAEVRSALG